jgi:hypothetical protein
MHVHHFAAAIIFITAVPAVGQSAPKAPEILGIAIGSDQSQVRKIAGALFPAPNYKLYEGTSNTGHQPLGFAYDRVDGGHDQFGVGFSGSGEVFYLVHIVEYNPPDPGLPGKTKAHSSIHVRIPLLKHKPKHLPVPYAASAGTDLNRHPTVDSFLAALIEKYGTPAASRDDLHLYVWYFDANFRPLSAFNVGDPCRSFPAPRMVNANTLNSKTRIASGSLFGRSYPAPPEAAESDCGTGIFVKLYTTGNGNPDINTLVVSGYELQVYNQAAAVNDRAQRENIIQKKQRIGEKPQL